MTSIRDILAAPPRPGAVYKLSWASTAAEEARRDEKRRADRFGLGTPLGKAAPTAEVRASRQAEVDRLKRNLPKMLVARALKSRALKRRLGSSPHQSYPALSPHSFKALAIERRLREAMRTSPQPLRKVTLSPRLGGLAILRNYVREQRIKRLSPPATLKRKRGIEIRKIRQGIKRQRLDDDDSNHDMVGPRW